MQQRCPNCGSPVIPGQRFCGGCGAQLSLSCPQCRITVSPGTRYCPNCGATLGGGPTQPSGYGSAGGGTPPQQPGWGQQPGMPPQQPGWGQQPQWGGPQPYAPQAPKSQSSSSTRPFLVLLLFILLLGMGALAYLQTPLGDTIDSILGISGSGGDTPPETVIDTTKPVISFPADPIVGPASVSITWATDELSSTQVQYGDSTTYGSMEPAQPQDDPTIEGSTSGGVVTHSVVITGLQPNTSYHYRVKSKDKSGNEAVSEDRTFTTTASEP